MAYPYSPSRYCNALSRNLAPSFKRVLLSVFAQSITYTSRLYSQTAHHFFSPGKIHRCIASGLAAKSATNRVNEAGDAPPNDHYLIMRGDLSKSARTRFVRCGLNSVSSVAYKRT